MAFTPRQARQEEMVSPKQRDALEKRRTEYLGNINDRLNTLEDSPYKQDLMKLRDHCFTKFPVFPVDLSVWIVAYYEDWMREFDKVQAGFS